MEQKVQIYAIFDKLTNANPKPINDEKTRKIIAYAKARFESWAEKFIEVMETDEERKAFCDQNDTKLISDALQANPEEVEKEMTALTVMNVIANKWYDYLVEAQLSELTDGKTRRRIARDTWSRLIKGGYVTKTTAQMIAGTLKRATAVISTTNSKT